VLHWPLPACHDLFWACAPEVIPPVMVIVTRAAAIANERMPWTEVDRMSVFIGFSVL